jgi:beta-glucosidase
VLKHFCAQGAAVGGHNGKSAVIGERELREIHLPPMKAAVNAGATACMAAYNEIDGIYCHANKRLLTGILRDEWGFDGVVMSDGCAVDNLRRVAGSDEMAVSMAVGAGVDLNLWSESYASLEKAVVSGLLDEKLVDKAVERVLALKFKLGLFDKPYTDVDAESAVFGGASAEKARLLNLKLARESVVLLKNEGNILPLANNLKRIAVIGPNADHLYNQLGDYTPPQREGTGSTLLQGICSEAGGDVDVVYVKGCGIRDNSKDGFAEAIKAAESADVVIMALGGCSTRDFQTKFDKNGAAIIAENSYDKNEMDCGEGMDAAGLELGGVQVELLHAVASSGKPVIAVMIQGRPYSLQGVLDKCTALLCAWYPGKEGGKAIAGLLFGKECPSGKLSVSIPRSSAQLPVYYNYKETVDYIDMPAAPLFPFGFGLSYTTYEYGGLILTYRKGAGGKHEGFTGSVVQADGLVKPNGLPTAVCGQKEADILQVSAAELENGAYIEVTADIKNTGSRKGAEVVQLYISGSASGISRRVRELKGFRKIRLEPGAVEKVCFRLGKEELGIWDRDMKFRVVPGRVRIIVGPDSTRGIEASAIIMY